MTAAAELNLMPGDWVEVRSEAEILATLDDKGALDGLVFMPEMLAFCGKRMQVENRADKTCDTVAWTGMLRMDRTVHLAASRCDGSSHGGCQANCLLFWKEAWLKRASRDHGQPPSSAAANGATSNGATSNGATSHGAPSNGKTKSNLDRTWLEARTRNPDVEGEVHYRCQATELRTASRRLVWWTPQEYWRDVTVSKVPVLDVVRGFAYSAINKFSRKLLKRGFPSVAGTLTRTPAETLGLQPGEWVVVKSKEEILDTLDKNAKNRGLRFDAEMVPYCGRAYRVLKRVDQIIDEPTGRLIRLPSVSILLDDVYCRTRFHRYCPRHIYLYWREIWLRRAKPEEIPAGCEGNAAGHCPLAAVLENGTTRSECSSEVEAEPATSQPV